MDEQFGGKAPDFDHLRVGKGQVTQPREVIEIEMADRVLPGAKRIASVLTALAEIGEIGLGQRTPIVTSVTAQTRSASMSAALFEDFARA
ncbi:MAG: hypothetical protein E5X33_29905 [Mesorhizobium sp.]|uniref:hypothetical protein n=1 Tax=Mesorhizobium sp. TaxID=1871066 RepID=UPI00120389A8|nr:hypothetical protein [Mesorhizobium sp.]TIR16149.1 MAG: hypothetical protein E5X33_29905 [Mesorhizobium sp.]